MKETRKNENQIISCLKSSSLIAVVSIVLDGATACIYTMKAKVSRTKNFESRTSIGILMELCIVWKVCCRTLAR